MFVQVIVGRTSDAQAVHHQLEVWEHDLMPGAVGYLGSTGGCVSSGECILVARFESAQTARENSLRPEQGSWWQRTEGLFDGPVIFHDTEDVEVMEHGDLDSSRFVQVMQGRVADRKRAGELHREADAMLGEIRPDLLGTVTVYVDDGGFFELAYFTDEGEARANESKQPPAGAAEMIAEWERVMKVDRYLDITEPWLVSAEPGFAAQ